MPLDIPTLFVVSTCITGLLGLFLLYLWIQDRSVRALGWWAASYLIGGFAVALWMVGPTLSPAWPDEVAPALLFICCGMIWSGARKFHNRDVLPLAVMTGAIVWLIASSLPEVAVGHSARIILSSVIIAAYAVLTAIELKRDRRRPQTARLRAIIVPVLHGAIFLSPILTIHFMPEGAANTGPGLNNGSFALFALLTLLYVVGTAFIVVVMAKEHAVRLHKTAAVTDPLTGLYQPPRLSGSGATPDRSASTEGRTGHGLDVRSRSFQIDQRSLQPPGGGRGAARLCENRESQHALVRYCRPVRR